MQNSNEDQGQEKGVKTTKQRNDANSRLQN